MIKINLFFRLKSDVEGTTLLDIEARYNKNNFVLKSYANVEEMKFDIVLKAITQWGKCRNLALHPYPISMYFSSKLGHP